jgi:hypothetical protein
LFQNNSKRESYIDKIRKEGKYEDAELLQKFEWLGVEI